MLNPVGFVAQRAVRQDRQHAGRARGEVRDQHEAARGVDDEVTGIGAMRRLAVQPGRRAGLLVDAERRNGAGRLALVLLELVDAVEIAAVAIQAQVGRIADPPGHQMRCQCAAIGVEYEGMYALPLSLKHLSGAEQDRLGIGADVDEIFLFHRSEMSVS